MSDEFREADIQDTRRRNRYKHVCEVSFIKDVAQRLQEKGRVNPGVDVCYSITEIVDAMQGVHLDRGLQRSHDLQELLQRYAVQEIEK